MPGGQINDPSPGKHLLFCSSQQLPSLGLGPIIGFIHHLSTTLRSCFFSLLSCSATRLREYIRCCMRRTVILKNDSTADKRRKEEAFGLASIACYCFVETKTNCGVYVFQSGIISFLLISISPALRRVCKNILLANWVTLILIATTNAPLLFKQTFYEQTTFSYFSISSFSLFRILIFLHILSLSN